jgi:hypothetical protein
MQTSEKDKTNNNRFSNKPEGKISPDSDFGLESYDFLDKLLESARREQNKDEETKIQSAEKQASSNEDLSTNDHNYSDCKKMIIEEGDFGKILEKEAGDENEEVKVNEARKKSKGRKSSRSDCSEDSIHNVPLRKKKKISERQFLIFESSQKKVRSPLKEEERTTETSHNNSSCGLYSSISKVSPKMEANFLTPGDSEIGFIKKKRKLQVSESESSQMEETSDKDKVTAGKSSTDQKSSVTKEDLLSARRDLKRLKKVIGSRKEERNSQNSPGEEQTCAICLGKKHLY